MIIPSTGTRLVSVMLPTFRVGPYKDYIQASACYHFCMEFIYLIVRDGPKRGRTIDVYGFSSFIIVAERQPYKHTQIQVYNRN